MTLSIDEFFFCWHIPFSYRWLHEINQNCDDVARVLVGNKCDDPDRRVVIRDDAGRFATQMGIQLFETSAKENINVEEMFRAITDLVLSSKRAQKEVLDRPQANIRIGQGRPNGGKDKKKSSCCKWWNQNLEIFVHFFKKTLATLNIMFFVCIVINWYNKHHHFTLFFTLSYFTILHWEKNGKRTFWLQSYWYLRNRSCFGRLLV